MKMHGLQNAVWTSLCAIALAVPVARAQQGQQSQQQTGQQSADQSSAPIPAYRSPFASAADNGDNAGDESQELTPDTRALSGAQYLSLGIPTARSYWQPHFDIFTTADSNPRETAKSTGWGSWTSLSGGIDARRTSENNDVTLSYATGGLFLNYTPSQNGVYQALNFADTFAFRRSSLSFFDGLSYLPGPSLGLTQLSWIVPSQPGSSGLTSALTEASSLLTGQSQLGNSFATELDTFLTPRTSLTFVGGYSLMRYLANDLLDSSRFSFRGGYNYQMTRKDTIAVIYAFGAYRYSNFAQSIDDHSLQISYGRRVPGRLAFQVAAGPQVVISRIPISGTGGSTSSGSGIGMNATQILWSANAAVQWQPNRTLLGLKYNHGVDGGSGVFAGAVTDIVTGFVTRQVSRTFSNALSAGYARNTGVAITRSMLANQTYDYWFAGASLSHPVGRALGLTLAYQMQYQTSNSTFCIGPTCGTNVIRHMISVGVGWHERPLLF